MAKLETTKYILLENHEKIVLEKTHDLLAEFFNDNEILDTINENLSGEISLFDIMEGISEIICICKSTN